MGFAFLGRLSEDYVNKEAAKHRLTEVESIKCPDCGVTFRLFAGPDLPKDEAEARSDIKDLTERANQFIFRDCPATVPEGQPKKPGHIGHFQLLESGKIAF